jgi:hypothetical protein
LRDNDKSTASTGQVNDGARLDGARLVDSGQVKAAVTLILQGRSAIIFNRSMLVMMPTGSFPCVTTNR